MDMEFDNSPRPLFIQMSELTTVPGHHPKWLQVIRWVKFEELLEKGGQRWSKPYVPTVQLKALKDLRKILENSVIRLNFECNSVEKACRTLVDIWVTQKTICESEKHHVLQTLLRPHVHLYETAWTISKSKFFKKKQKDEVPIVPEIHEKHGSTHRRMSFVSSLVYVPESKEETEKNVQFLRKIPENAECANILVGELDSLEQPVGTFLRFDNPEYLGNLSEVHLPTRFIFILLAPPGIDYVEIGRAISTLFTDPSFKEVAYRATSKDKLLKGIDAYLDTVAVLPPSTWDKSIRLDPPHKSEGSGHGGGDGSDSEQNTGLQRTGQLFGGLIKDIKRKVPWYSSDIRDALSLQILATWMFLFFACLTPMITFGGLMGLATHNSMGTMETLVAGCVCGIGFALFSGQPLIILGSTGPVLVFEKILVNFSESNGWNYLEFRLWVGVWIAVILILLVATDASSLVSYITRFTEDNFATLIACIFMVEAVKNVMLIGETHSEHGFNNDTKMFNNSTTNQLNETTWDWDYEIDHDATSGNETTLPNILDPYQAQANQSKFLMSLLLFFGTFFVSYMLKEFRVSPFFPTWFRYLVSDFAVILAIGSMTFVDYMSAIDTPKLAVPEKFAPTSDERGWFIPPFGKNPIWSIFVASVPALLATILIFMDQQITAVIVNRNDNKLKKGSGYHLDLFVLALLITLGSFFGLPWFVAATVESLTNLSSLRMESESAIPGEKPTFLGIREQRVSSVLIFSTVGLSVLLTPVLRHVPMPVLYGVFLYMGFSALLKMDLFQRILLFLIPLKYQPDLGYLRQVPLRRVHLFTVIQLLCLILLWIIKSLKITAIFFPLMLVVMIVTRMLLEYVFNKSELLALDDPLPGKKDDDDDDASEFGSTEFNGHEYNSVAKDEV